MTWIQGTSSALGEQAFDAAVMTSHVAQFFVDDGEWDLTLADLKRSLVPAGRLSFDTRDPADRRWERWNPVDSRRQVSLPDGREVTEWTEVTAVDPGVVSCTVHYAYPDADELVSTATLRFRSEDEIRSSLRAAGFVVEHVYGGWSRQPVGAGDGEFIVVARA